MRTAGAMAILALGAGSTAFGQEALSRDQQIADLKQQLAAVSAKLDSLQTGVPTALETRLDGAVRNSPTEALREPRRLNISAPGLEGLNISGLVHVRGDYWGNYDTGSGKNDVNSLGTEAQLAFDARVSEKTSVGLTMHYSDVWGNNTGHGLGTDRLTDSLSSDEGQNVDMQEAFLKVGDIYGTSVDMTAGRQRVEFGAERIMGDDDWRLRRTSLDGFRFDNNLGDAGGCWTLVALRLNDSDNAALVDDLVPAVGGNVVDNADLFGFYYTVKPGEMGTVDAYIFQLEDMNYPGGFDRTRFTTYGARWESPDWDGLHFEGEGATQFGELLGDRTHNYGFGTYAVHADVGFHPSGIEFFDGFHAGYDYATGGTDPSDNFTQITPSLHGWFGITDFFGWSNIQHVNLSTSFKLGDGTMAVGYHWNRRASDNAGFAGYNAASAGTGGSKDLGEEADVTYSMECSKSTTVSMGLGYFFAGEGFHDLTGVSNDMPYAYFAATTRF